jgi:large subunit ribosomal protein L3
MLGRKIGMMGIYSQEGQRLPVTVVEAGPCVVTQIKTDARDGYNALQLGFGSKKAKHTSKPLQGHFAKCGKGPFANLAEFAVEDPESYSVGQVLSATDLFEIGELVDVSGLTKGRGFAGVIKRHGFHGGKQSHGSHSHRVPGSIGCSAWPAKVIKGKKLPGRYGNERKTIKNLEIVDIRPDDNLILIKGSLPGHRSGIVAINKLKKVDS